MVEKIYEIKNQFLEKMMNDIEERGGIERVNVDEMYKLADIVKDLAEAEKECWEAEYYRSVTEAMGQQGSESGYNGMSGNQMGYNAQSGRSGSQNGSQSGYNRQGTNQYTSRRGYAQMRGYDLSGLRMAMQNADPQERERMKQELRNMM